MSVIVEELEALVNKFSPDNGRLANIKISDEIVAKLEIHFEKVRNYLKASEINTYNFSIEAILGIMPAKFDRDLKLPYAEQNQPYLFSQLIHHIRAIIALYRTVYFRARL